MRDYKLRKKVFNDYLDSSKLPAKTDAMTSPVGVDADGNLWAEGSTPTGTINITQNGVVDVTNYASANVNVPASAVVSGTKSIRQNGTGIDVTNYASVDVNVAATSNPTMSTITVQNNMDYTIHVAGLGYENLKPQGGSQTRSLIYSGGYDAGSGNSTNAKGWFWFNNNFVRGAQGIIRITKVSGLNPKPLTDAVVNPTDANTTVTPLGSNYFLVSTNALVDTVTITVDPQI